MTLTRILQNSPIEALIANLAHITDSLLELLQSQWLKCATQLLESLISLVLAVEYEFEPYGKKFIPCLLDCINNKGEWNTRKMSIDVIYTFASFLPDCIADDIEAVIRTLKERKADKIKHVREAAQEALAKIKSARNKSGHAIHQSPPKPGPNEDSKEEKKEAAIPGKSIFERPMNPNFIKAAPKSKFLKNSKRIDKIEIVTSENPNKKPIIMVSEPKQKHKLVEDAKAKIKIEEEIPEKKEEHQTDQKDMEIEFNQNPLQEVMQEPIKEQVQEPSPSPLPSPSKTEVQNPIKEETEPPQENIENPVVKIVEGIQAELERVSKQQMKLIESMNSFQALTRKEIGCLQERMTYIEEMVERVSKSIDYNSKGAENQQKAQENVGPPREGDTAWLKAIELISVHNLLLSVN
jgi:hypothetical protein